jgi:DNA replication and repair protein RecF
VLATGLNGAGKTNLLEALHVGIQGFSPRARSDAQMVRFGAAAGSVAARGERGGMRFETDVLLSVHEARRARLNGSALRSAEQLRHELSALVFTPDRLALVKGGPSVRRAYVDRCLGRFFPSRAGLAVEYAAAVGQRNAALRRVATGVSAAEAVAPWTQAVVTLGEALVDNRKETIRILAERLPASAGPLGLAELTISYEGSPATLADLDERLPRDVERGSTGAGPHLHDVRIETGGRELRSFGSQGEQRIAVLALILAEAAALAERTGSTPLLLLDDVLSELDGDRRRSLADLISGCRQTIMTATTRAGLTVEPALTVVVEPGLVRRG